MASNASPGPLHCLIWQRPSREQFILYQLQIAVHVEHVWFVLNRASPDLELWFAWTLRVKQDEAHVEDPGQDIKAGNVVLRRVGGNDDLRFVAKQSVGTSLTECCDQTGRGDLYLSRDDFGWKLDDVAFLWLTYSNDVRGTPLVLEGIATDGDCLRALLQFVDEVVAEWLVKLLLFDLLSGRRRDLHGFRGAGGLEADMEI